MKFEGKVILNIFWVILGAALMALSSFGAIDAAKWFSFGAALLFVGVLQGIKNIKYIKNEKYKEKVDIEINDERNKFISMKAWSWAGYLFVIISGVLTIVFMILGNNQYMMMSSYGVCLIILLYWISYLVLRRKY